MSARSRFLAITFAVALVGSATAEVVCDELVIELECVDEPNCKWQEETCISQLPKCSNPPLCTQDANCCSGFTCQSQSVEGARQDTKTCVEPPSFSLSCPPVGSHSSVPPGKNDFLRSRPNDLCTLTLIKENNAGDIRAVVPIARTYLGNAWSRAAGAVAARTFDNNPITCNPDKSCTINLPDLPERQYYRLSSYQYSISARNERARFLEMTTFGTTRSDLDSSWSFANEAEWVEHQMKLPLSSHREYFRERATPRWTFSQKAGRSDHPCDVNSRWRRFTFTRKDKYQGQGFASGFLYVRNTTSTSDPSTGQVVPSGPYILFIDGHARTVVQEFRWNNNWIQEQFPTWDSSHAYQICSSPKEYVGGQIYLQTQPFSGAPQGTCRVLDEGSGNPAINFTGFESYMGPYVFNLEADDSLELIDEWKDAGEVKFNDRYILGGGIASDLCKSVPTQAEDFDKPIFLIHPKEGVLQWDPRLELETNTRESPIPDGGGTTELATDGRTLCANVPRTYLNFDDCKVTDQPSACGSGEAPDTLIQLDSNSLLQLHALTGRYVYAIEGLKVQQRDFAYEVAHPCTPGQRSRWERNAGATCEKSVRQATRKALRKLIAKSVDENPYVRDITFPSFGSECDSRDIGVEIEIQVDTDCWKHVHPEHLGVFDVTYWTRSDTHPGNVVAQTNSTQSHPIKKFLDGGSPILVYPSNHPLDGTLDHPMTRWDSTEQKFEYLARLGDSISFRDLPDDLKTDKVAEFFGASSGAGTGIFVCGSPGEVANDASKGSVFDVSSDFDRDTTYRDMLGRQREIVWTMIALYGKDQLRQRMAWALSQILVIAKPSIEDENRSTEIFLQFYDIFVRHAFGNYLDVLCDISYSPLMGENLSFVNSRSSAYVWEQYGRIEFADENFAREILQLFSTGLLLLNLDGTPKLDENGEIQKVYTNDDIRSFSRAWTGFTRQRSRGNYEEFDNSNRIDPMAISVVWRDKFPKTNLYGGYIGDQYPLCVDLASKQFLRKGSSYRLLGSSPMPELMKDSPMYTRRFVLDKSSSGLYVKLCDDRGSGCRFPNEVTLDRNLQCSGLECKVDTVRVLQVESGVFYEYVQPPCVEHSFYNNAMKLNTKSFRRYPVCGNPLLPIATSACCEEPDDWTEAISDNLYDIERMTFATQDSRCNALNKRSCDYDVVDMGAEYWQNDLVFHWAYAPCSIQAKVNPDGEVALIHDTPTQAESNVLHVNNDTRNYFGVTWENGVFPQEAEGGCGACRVVEGVNCVCEAWVEEEVVFRSNPDSKLDILSVLHIGAPNPESFDEGTYSAASVNGYIVHKQSTMYAGDTIFEVRDDKGRTHFLKNTRSKVILKHQNGTLAGFSFRNPVQFMSLVPSETNKRDAMYETEATLQHYFYHDNTAPFLCVRFIQRFGISNASPRYVKSCSLAFRRGTYQSRGRTFGTGKYGDLAATVASIVLDMEARSVILDADPAAGSVREPLIRVISLMRNLEFQAKDSNLAGETPTIVFNDMEEFIGQMAHEYPTVFSFFLPEYQPEGPVLSASLVAPEAQLLDMPKTIDLLNGLHSLIKYGLSECYEDDDMQYGFGYALKPDVGFGRCSDNGQYNRATGLLAFQPAGTTSLEVINDLSTMLTAGRLNEQSKQIIMKAYEDAVLEDGVEAGVRIAQQLITTSPEFHTTNPVKLSGLARPNLAPPPNSGRPYKAVIYLMLSGGADSFNMLVPNECSAPEGEVDAYTHYAESRNPVHLMNENLLPIDGSGQVNCDKFGVHNKLPIVQELYNDGDLLFFANTGVLGKPTRKGAYFHDNPTQLFAHNSMSHEARVVDLFGEAAGVGILGRLTDALAKTGATTGSFSLDKSSPAVAGIPGFSPMPFVVSQYGVRKFMPQDARTMSKQEMLQAMRGINNGTREDSGFMASTWSTSLVESLHQNDVLHSILEDTNVTADFGDTELGRKLEIVSKMISTREMRRTDVDVFYVEIGGFDAHSGLEENLNERFSEVNSGLNGFVKEMKTLGLWDNVALLEVSEFARTLSPNSGSGTDHAWGGHYFMCGGAVKGGQILGQYPADMSETSELNIGRGRLIPTTSWDVIWPGIAQWAGVTDAADFDEICPNRKNFDMVFQGYELFENAPQTDLPQHPGQSNPPGSQPPTNDPEEGGGGEQGGEEGGNTEEETDDPSTTTSVAAPLLRGSSTFWLSTFIAFASCTFTS